jgi:hypothetical protein
MTRRWLLTSALPARALRFAARQMSRRVRAVIGTIGILIGFVVVIGFVVLTVFYLHR